MLLAPVVEPVRRAIYALRNLAPVFRSLVEPVRRATYALGNLAPNFRSLVEPVRRASYALWNLAPNFGGDSSLGCKVAPGPSHDPFG